MQRGERLARHGYCVRLPHGLEQLATDVLTSGILMKEEVADVSGVPTSIAAGVPDNDVGRLRDDQPPVIERCR